MTRWLDAHRTFLIWESSERAWDGRMILEQNLNRFTERPIITTEQWMAAYLSISDLSDERQKPLSFSWSIYWTSHWMVLIWKENYRNLQTCRISMQDASRWKLYRSWRSRFNWNHSMGSIHFVGKSLLFWNKFPLIALIWNLSFDVSNLVDSTSHFKRDHLRLSFESINYFNISIGMFISILSSRLSVWIFYYEICFNGTI